MTTWPAGSKATTTHTDAGSDKPRLARVDINQNILNTNDVIDMFAIASPTNGEILVYNTSTANFKTSDNNSAPIKLNKNYIETVYSITGTSGSIDVDASLASVHKMTLNDNTTFTFTNMSQGQSVTLIITVNANGKSATFTSDGSTRVKFPGGAPTLTQLSGNIDYVVVFYDGSNFIGNIIQRIS
jgi:hypothetical protein